MIKLNSSLSFCKSILFTLTFSGTSLFAQHNENTNHKREESVITAYNVPFSYSLDTYTDWEIKNNNGELLNSGSGSIAKLFSKPGTYILYIHEKHNHNSTSSCDHVQYPSKVNITVSPLKLLFDFSTIKFSKNIQDSQSREGIVVTVNAMYNSYESKAAVYNHGFTTAGVGTSVRGKLKGGKTILKEGVNTLEFLLEGFITKGNNIMLDFKDINGQVQSYTLTEKIK